uniref:Myb-like domain-containing protein n=1 Tax=Cucumis sativus TaxID=3659 RepID=A0A0A0LF88_CUCSA
MEESKAMKQQPKKNLWKPEEDLILRSYVETHGEGNWAIVSQESANNSNSCKKNDDNNSDDGNNKKQKKVINQIYYPQPPICSDNGTDLAHDIQRRNQEENREKQDPWNMDDITSSHYNINSPMIPANNTTFNFDDEPYFDHLDPFFLFEAFGCSSVDASLDNM